MLQELNIAEQQPLIELGQAKIVHIYKFCAEQQRVKAEDKVMEQWVKFTEGCRKKGVFESAMAIFESQSDFHKITAKEQLQTLALAYCQAMQVGPTVPIYYLMWDFERSMRRHNNKNQKKIFFQAIEIEMSAYYRERQPEVKQLVGKQLIEELESLDKDNTWRSVAYFFRYRHFSQEQIVRGLLWFRAQRLLQLKAKLCEVVVELWYIQYLKAPQINLKGVINIVRDINYITQLRRHYGLFNHEDSLQSIIGSKFKGGLFFIKTLFKNEKQC